MTDENTNGSDAKQEVALPATARTGQKWSCVDCGKRLKRRGYKCDKCKLSNKPPQARRCQEPGCSKKLKPRFQRCESHRRKRAAKVKARRKLLNLASQPSKE